MPVVDVIVIGAGLSGLIAARDLQRANYTVAVLESRTRVGGRVLASPNGSVDLGGSWAWPAECPHVLALGRELGVEAVPQRTDGDAFHAHAGGVTNIGVRGQSVIPSGPGAVRPGYVEIAARLAAGLGDALHLEARVASVRKNGRLLDVIYGRDARVMRSRRVVVALPPAVLGSIVVFEPPLAPGKLAKALRTATWCGDWVKLSLHCRSAFWRETGASGIVATAGQPFEVYWEGGSKALVGLGVGPRALAFAKNSDQAALRHHALATLGPVFPMLRDQLESVHCQAWALEDETFAPGASERDYGHALLRAPTDWGVHFAGTETERMNGHAEGAVVAGMRAAKEVHAALAGAMNMGDAALAGAMNMGDAALAGAMNMGDAEGALGGSI